MAGDDDTFTLSKEEHDVYDRQIRIWGYDFQKKLTNVSILLIGCKLLGQEFCKNVLLGGVRKLTLMDDEMVTVHTNKFIEPLTTPDVINCRRCEALKNTCSNLNPFASIETIDQFDPFSDNYEQHVKTVVANFDFVVYTLDDIVTCEKLENWCLSLNVPFIFGMCFEKYGFMFNGTPQKMLFPRNETSERFFLQFNTKKYPSSCLSMLKLFHPSVYNYQQHYKLVFPEDTINNIFSNQESNEKPKKPGGPVASVIGAVIAQELFKIIGNGLEPIKNYFHYDMSENVGIVVKL